MRLLLIVVMILTTSPAIAGWQWTRWGMSEQEVRLAGAGLVSDNLDRRYDPGALGVARLRMDYVADGTATTAYLGFSADDELVVVDLIAETASSCSGLIDRLAINEPADLIISRTWPDRENDNFIEFLFIPPDYCQVRYTAIPTAYDRGGL